MQGENPRVSPVARRVFKSQLILSIVTARFRLDLCSSSAQELLS